GTLSAAGTIATGGTGTGGSLGSQGAVALSDDGRRLFAVNAGSNDVSVFDVGPTGLSLASQTASGGTLPISLTAHGSLPYVLNAGNLSLVSGAVLTHRGAPCWAVVTDDGRFGYTGNGSGSVSAFGIAPSGAISLVDADGATAVVSGGVNDIALSGNSRYLYVLGTGATPAIYAFRLEAD